VPDPKTTSPFVVLRRDPAAHDWLAAARRRVIEAPGPVRVLLAGRSRVEVGPAEADAALAWAAGIPGWDDDARPPLFVHTPGDMLARG
jgi:hypothetical protein